MTETADVTDFKTQFAYQLLLLRDNAMSAAMFVFPNNRMYQLFVAQYWPTDEFVLMERRRFLDKHGHAFFLPTLYDISVKTMDIAETALTVDARLAAIKLYAQLNSMLAPNGTAVTVNNNSATIDARKVMIVRDHGTDDEWQTKLQANQRKLATATLEG